MTAATEALVRGLEAHDVDVVFGVCGDTTIGLYRTLVEMDHDLEHVLARDERAASYMAEAYGRVSDRPGVCEGPSGGGATYQLPGLAEATDSSVPVIALNTNIPVRYRGRGVLTELDQDRLYDPVTVWNDSIDHPEQVPYKLRQAFRQATVGRPGGVHLSLPMDVLDQETDGEPYADTDATRYPAYRPSPDADRLDDAATTIAESERPVIVAGGGVHGSGAWYELRALAESAGIPVAQTLTSVGCIGDSPYSIGVVGENGSRAYANEMLAEADTLLLLGTAVESVWTEKWSRPADGEKRIVHADIDATSIGKNYRADVALPGDLRTTIEELLARLNTAEKWDADRIRHRHRDWIEPFEAEYDSDEFPVRPERMVADAAEVLDEDALIISDPGTSVPYFAALYPFSEPGHNWITPRAHGALGYTIPAVVGAHYAAPDRQVVGYTGDGSFGTTAGELETLGRLDVPVTVVVVNNESFSWIEAGQQSFAEFSFAVDFEELNYAAIAEEFGVTGFRVEAADEYADALRSAVDIDGPALIDLPTRPLPTLDNTPVDWLEPDE
ncbi:MAG: thiamine pyrophosphate-binding protein [Halobacteriales archaeon]|nr:thiamine pyrophosphate-binding protein [Halobacteriales archaeon]